MPPPYQWIQALERLSALAGFLLLSVQFWSASIASEPQRALSLSPAPIQGTGASAGELCPAQLGGAIASITNRPEFRRARWGLFIQTLNADETLYAQESERYFVPGSNVKLLTTAAALHQLGSQFRIRTSVYQVGSQSGTVLRVVGRGDPSLTDAELRQLAQQIRDRGITQVSQLVGDDSYFRGDAVNPTWEWEDVQAGYGAPVNSLILNQNAIALTLLPQALGQPLEVRWQNPSETLSWLVDNRSVTVAATEPEFVAIGRDLNRPVLQIRGQLRIGAAPDESRVAVTDPAESFIERFQQILASEQIGVDEIAIASSPVSENASEVAAVESPPLAELLIQANRESNNLYAESLLRQLGINQSPLASTSALAAGLAAVEGTLTPLGVDPQSYDLADGSGLSRHNLVSPEALVQTLRAMARSPEASFYRDSLAVAGISGTLQNRFLNTPVQGNLQGKTGALNGVAALSGYFDSPSYQPLVFSIIVNQFEQPVRVIRQAIDEIVLLLAQLHPC